MNTTLSGSGTLAARIQTHLSALVSDIGPRPSGSPSNRRATDYLSGVLHASGLQVRQQPFACKYWEPGPGQLDLSTQLVDVSPSPFSPPCDLRGRVIVVDSRAQIDALPATGGILVIRGELAKEPYFPKAFPFLRLSDQLAVITSLEAAQPAAVIAVTATGWPPLFEDADLAFPSVTVDATVGAQLIDGAQIGIRLAGRVHDGAGVNITAGRRTTASRIVLCAHVDTKVTTPGAFDNAGGVSVLLALAEAGLPDDVELVFFNGEDHYAAPGEQAWLAQTDLAAVRMAVNLDGAGVAGRRSSVAALACADAIVQRLEREVRQRDGWVMAAPWFESDHAIFAMQGIPSLAITCDGAHELLATVAHTSADTVDMVDAAVLADAAGFVSQWLTIVREEGLL